MSKKNGPEPFFRPKKNRWYVEIDGKHVNLGPDESQARIRWHQIMAGTPATPTNINPSPSGVLVCRVIDLFVGWSLTHRPGRTAQWYQKHLQSFLDSLPDAATLTADQLKRHHVTNWVDAHGTWGANHRRGAITAVQRAFTWAEREGHITRSPIRGIEKPPAKRREQVLTLPEFQSLLTRIKEPAFRDVLEFCWETGSRVQEVRLIESQHVRFDRGRIELPPQQAKGKKRWRMIYLTPIAEDIVRRLIERRPSGLLFRNAAGEPWEAQNFNNRFCRLQHRMGREELVRQGFTLDPDVVQRFAKTLTLTKKVRSKTVPKSDKELLREARKKLTIKHAAKLGTKYALTAIRHSYCQRLLEAGVDSVTVATLMGHVDSVMVSRVYSHMGQATDHLRAALLRASPERASAEVAVRISQ
ncbi:MAG: tyrosine-type recombinase/integrase [Planctomycetes bacterium]|nr:tyrosine-type recombinase/integrase [Planctomycetota bacterium]